MITLTYGQMPSREAFEAAFESACPSGSYSIRNDPYFGDMDFHLPGTLGACMQEDSVDSEDWVSCILFTLGFEWI